METKNINPDGDGDGDPSMDFPHYFRCPISMELMKDPVTISTGVTYERKNIEKWFHIYHKQTCPATMQFIQTIHITPNHTLKRLISSWRDHSINDSTSTPPSPSVKNKELEKILETMETTPFKANSLRNLKSILETGDREIKRDFKNSGWVHVLIKIIIRVLSESSDFASFRACEEAVAVLNQVPFSDDDESILQLLMQSDCVNSMGVMLQRGSAEARLCTVSIFERIAAADYDFNFVVQEQGIDFFKSLLEIISDEICTKASGCALRLLIEIMGASRKSRLKSIEAGAVCTLVELLPESNRSRCEKILHLIKLLCECSDGRVAFIDHGLGIAAVSKKVLSVSTAATKIGVKILWSVSSFHPTERVLEEMLACGAVNKMVALLHVGGGQSTTKDRVLKMLKMHGGAWRRFPCFPSDVKEYLGLGNDHTF